MLKISQIEIPANYVLVKADEDYETYQIEGRDTGIRNALSVGTAGQRMSIYGTILKNPDQLVYNGNELRAARSRSTGKEEDQDLIDRLRNHSVMYDVPIETKVGDRILFFYKSQLDCYKDNRVLFTDEGTVMLMKYDSLYAVVHENENLYPLNGYVFLELKELQKEKVTEGGLHLLEKTHQGVKAKKGVSIGRVVEAGCFVKGYLEFLDRSADSFQRYSPDQHVYFNGLYSRNLQFALHQTLKVPRLVVHRKDIYGIIPDISGFEFAN